ncbi:hypothetical protein BU14_0457s0022 [Porphyra umbilicalis]|uniref:Uncharacterized protein n=1 Tax=Porphyra umbilicalis TaxID=2786 RepID=A0A1X6NUC2_PORUM|nr:hypothetical protein BU14_0457s0022 [Porphyra umbilicalis]|eukprot:OSX72229.1 hypothetical protein BU14_0457s0022 [Porphyra umbilicalis]
MTPLFFPGPRCLSTDEWMAGRHAPLAWGHGQQRGRARAPRWQPHRHARRAARAHNRRLDCRARGPSSVEKNTRRVRTRSTT